jgi:hypothetical protein
LAGICDRAREFLQELPYSAEIESLIPQMGALGRQFGDNDRSLSSPSVAELSDAFPALHQLPTCEVCAQIADKLWDFLCKYQYEIIANNEARECFTNRGSLCPFHAWQLHSVASPYGMCVAYPPLLDRLAAEFREFASSEVLKEMPTKIRKLVPSAEECALCNVRDGAERMAIAATASRFEKYCSQALNSLSAICLPHIGMFAAKIRNRDLVRLILERQAALLQRYSEDMRRYAVKYDAARRYLASQEERTVAERGLLLVTGHRQVNFAPSVSDIRTPDYNDQ